ncbi:glycosyltransferase involved in cell wall biosynthesis [Salinibacter ruber]|uniref:glycosyltransferase family 4 protein n=1 Tax=Salinibacter ruber TaxID=146919 RepID=UPI0021682AB2|nr:glycosyltransferase family 4 protein [Salinibacter ruber]MCS3629297.1 glycosyltransferase involved in cell wall biosynthesis [Salinibacter ruber]MCS4146205.1 glycosyltransferase involved in cell wall biosynthesis [Salinibacter ruber]
MESSLRILMHCGGSHMGGAEVVALNLMEGLQERGHEIHCTMSGWNDGDFIDQLEALEISYTPIKLGVLSKRLTNPKYLRWTLDALVHLPGALYRYWRVQRAFDPHVVLMHSPRAAWKLRPLLEAEKTVYYIHSTPADSARTRLAFGEDGKQGAAYVAVSKFIGNQLASQLPPEKIEVIPNGVQTVQSCREESIPENSEGDPLTVGIVGQVGQWKGHEDFVRALHLLAECDLPVPVRGVIVGKGAESYENHLRDEIRNYGISERIEWRGFVQDTDAIYAGLDVCVVPSRFREPFGLVAAEAGIRGLPVIATRRGGLPEIIEDEETGFLVDAEEPNQIADRLEKLARTPNLRNEMGTNAQEHVRRHFTVERMVDQIEVLLKRVAASRRSSRSLS